jgi:hypothetical protein
MASARGSKTPQLWLGLLQDRLGRGGRAAVYPVPWQFGHGQVSPSDSGKLVN